MATKPAASNPFNTSVPPSGRSIAIEIADGFLTEQQLAEQLGVAVSTLRRWHFRRIGPPRSAVSRRFYYSRQKLQEWIEAQALTIKGR